MFLTEIFEPASSNYLVIYPGRFQPFHKGHKAVYDYLLKRFGRDNVFIATSNRVAPPKSPFSFSDKTVFMQLTGIPMDRVIETVEPYKSSELVNQYPDQTKLIFAVSAKDMAEDPRFKNWTKKDGSPAYFQPIPKNFNEMQGKDLHGYILTVPTFKFTVLGKPMNSATEVRKQFARSDEKTQKMIVKDLFGAYNQNAYYIMRNALQKDATKLG
jgi:hypothetical protein